MAGGSEKVGSSGGHRLLRNRWRPEKPDCGGECFCSGLCHKQGKRQMAGGLLRKEPVPLGLRHGCDDITNGVYGHRTLEELRTEIEKIKVPGTVDENS